MSQTETHHQHEPANSFAGLTVHHLLSGHSDTVEETVHDIVDTSGGQMVEWRGLYEPTSKCVTWV